VGGGPWHQSYTGEVLLSAENLEPVDAVQLLEVRSASSMVGDLEVGFGVAPFLDVAFAAAVRNGVTDYALDEDVQDQIAVPSRPESFPMSTWQKGVRAQVAPFPRWPARPTGGLGLAFWSGSGIPESFRFPRLEPPRATLLEVLPGVEADATPIVALSLRGLLSIPLTSQYVRTTEIGEPLMTERPTPAADRGIGFAVQAGLLLRLGPVWGDRVRPIGPAYEFDDEP
jgi:hypothetical protein